MASLILPLLRRRLPLQARRPAESETLAKPVVKRMEQGKLVEQVRQVESVEQVGLVLTEAYSAPVARVQKMKEAELVEQAEWEE